MRISNMNISTHKWQLLLKNPKSVTLQRRFRPTNTTVYQLNYQYLPYQSMHILLSCW